MTCHKCQRELVLVCPIIFQFDKPLHAWWLQEMVCPKCDKGEPVL